MSILYKNILFVFLVLSFSSFSYAAKIKGSPHDLSSVASGGTCNFCHTPHGAMRGMTKTRLCS